MAATSAGDTAARSEAGAPGARSLDGAILGSPATPLLIAGRLAPPGGLASSASTDGRPLDERILDATLVCVARWGVAKTTLDDIASEAGCSRATVYRVLPGGKDALMMLAAAREVDRFFAHLRSRLAAEATVVDQVALSLVEASRVIAGHAALQYLVEHEPEVVFPFGSFDALDPLLDAAGSFGEVTLGPFVDNADARSIGEWAARIVLSYGFEPDETIDLTDVGTARTFVQRYLPHLIPAGTPALSPVAGCRAEQEHLHVKH